MKTVIWLPPSCALILILAGCTNQHGSDPTATPGPFDSAGNYREDWADDPSKWRKPGKKSTPGDDLPVIAKNEEPPPNANPLAPKGMSSPKPAPVKVESKPRETPPREIAKHTDAPKHTETPKHSSTAKHTEEPKVAAKSKPKETVVKSKPKTKSKPKSERYIVKSGDSLSRIASRNGSSVSAIQRANGISGTLIHPGQSLVIPKR